MEWIKVKVKHVEFEYTDWSDELFRAWIKTMTLCAILERIPTKEQLDKHLGKGLTKELTESLTSAGTSLETVLNKVFEDVERTKKEREYARKYMPVYREKQAEKEVEEPSHTKEVLRYFTSKYYEKLKKTYVVTYGKELKIIKDILRQKPVEEVYKLIDKFFESDDEFIISAGFTIGIFKGTINKLDKPTMPKKEPKKFGVTAEELRIKFEEENNGL